MNINRFLLHEGCLCINGVNAYDKVYTRIAIPPSLVQSVLNTAHINTGHGGVVRMVEHIKTFAWWKYIRPDTEKFCKNCSVCKQD